MPRSMAERWSVLLCIALDCVALEGVVACRGGADAKSERAEFDASAAQASMKHAAALALADCAASPAAPRAGPEGAGEASVRFEASGLAGSVRVLPDALGNSARGACIERVFRFEVAVPAFRGSSLTLVQPIAALPARPEGSAYPRPAPAFPTVAGAFDWAAAGLSVFRAARQVSEQCPPLPGGPTGSGRVRLQFGNDGKVQRTQLLNARFQDTPTGECIQRLFAAVSVPPYHGEANELLKGFVVGSAPPPAPDFDYEAAAQALANHPPPFDAAAAAQALKEAAAAASACRQRDAWGFGEVQVDYLNVGMVDHSRLLGERFEGTETGNCVRNAFRKARVPVFSGPSASLVQGFDVQPSVSFDEVQALEALQDAAKLATTCKPKSGPQGPLEVGARFAPDGHVQRAAVMTEAFSGSVAASCVEMVFRRVHVPAFDGPAPPLFQQLEIQLAAGDGTK